MGRRGFLATLNHSDTPIRIEGERVILNSEVTDLESFKVPLAPAMFVLRSRNPRRWYFSDLSKGQTYTPNANIFAAKEVKVKVHRPSEFLDIRYQRPRIRQDCEPGGINQQRPCPWVSCRYHLYLDIVDERDDENALEVNFPQKEVWEIPHTCLLDVTDLTEEVDHEALTLEEIADLLGYSVERTESVLRKGMLKVRARWVTMRLNTEVDDDNE